MYCLYFAPNLIQRGEMSEGIDGFLLPDIRKELRRASQLSCCHCGQKFGSVGCGVAACSSTFHLPCGQENGAYTDFHNPRGSFPVYCKKHRPRGTKLPSFKGTKMCTICQEDTKFSSDRTNLLFVSCCGTYFHRSCLSQMAYQMGQWNLKCPNCQNDSVLVTICQKNGIHVPCRDYLPTPENGSNVPPSNPITWECCAEHCRCESGRNHNGMYIC